MTTRTLIAGASQEPTATPRLNQLLNLMVQDYDQRVLCKCRQRGHSQVRVSHLTLISHLGRDSLRLTTLAARAGITQQAMGKVVKEMDQLGYIQRNEDPQDKRAKPIQLTATGQQLAADYETVIAEVSAEYQHLIGEREIEALRSNLSHSVLALRDNKPQAMYESLTA